MLLKNLRISSVFSLLRICWKDVVFRKIFSASAYFGHLVMMWSIDRSSLHVLHTRAESSVIRKEWVRCVWPIMTRVIMTSSHLLRLQGKFHFLMKVLIFLNLFENGTLVYFSCHSPRILRLMVSSASEDVIRLSCMALWGSVASFANLSALSLPEMPTWEGTHIKVNALLVVDISSWMCCTSSFLE